MSLCGGSGRSSLTSIYRNSTAILPWILCTGLLLAGAPAQAGGALPTNGQYVAGQGTIAGSTNGLTINQATNHGIINWQGFSIGAGNSVLFNNGTGSTLNRVIGADISKIDGQLSATGSVYLINPQGIVIGPGGKVVTSGSFVASTRDISNNAFMSGGAMTASGTSNGDVVNAGAITSANGDAILVGRSISNSGTISAPNGTAALAAGNQILLQPVGSDPRIAVSGGTGDATNSGTIAAAQAQLSSAGGNVYAIAGNNGGIVSATGTQTINGHVWLTAGGTTNVSGTVSATNANGSGGTVTARGTDINVSGQVNASATQAGQAGGNVSVVAADTTTLAGTIKAQGGQGGAGGYVETSGEHLHVADSASISTTAEGGTTGTWLIDPQDFTIAASGGDITGATLSSELATTDVTILSSSGATAGNGDIFVDDAVSWSSSHALTLSAYRNIDINANIVVSGGGSLSLVTGTGTIGDYNIASGSSVSFTGGSAAGAHLSINGNAYTLLYSMSDVQAINATSSALGGNYALAQSLDATSTSGWTPLGTDGAGNLLNSNSGFVGAFTGLGNTISNLTVDTGSNEYAGLFGFSLGTIRDIGLIGGSTHGTGHFVGALAGKAGGTIKNAYATGTVSGSNSVGGLVGDSTANISGSYATGTVTATGNDAGGLIGQMSSGTVEAVYATGAVNSSASDVGGLIGLKSNGTLNDTYATGSVTGAFTAVGGLVGDQSGGAITNAYATGSVSGNSNVGGLIGLNDNSITNVYASGTVSGSSGVGGLVGSDTGGNGTITNGYWNEDRGGTTGVGSGDPGTEIGLTGSAAFTASSYGGFTFTTTPGTASAWVLVDSNGSLNNASGSAGGTMPMLAFEYATNITNAHQLQLMAMNTSASYTLGQSIDVGGTGSGKDVWGSAGFTVVGGFAPASSFTGSFDGGGNTISNLTENTTATVGGLFGEIGVAGTVKNVNLKNVSITSTVTSQGFVGGLAGENLGTISGVSSSGTVAGTGITIDVGGLVGLSQGTISNSSTAGTVGGVGTSLLGQTAVGGLIGLQSTTATVGNVHSSASVSGSGSGTDNAGGLIGRNIGTITDAYATGSVSGTNFAGGLAGFATGGSINQSYATGSVTGDSAGGLIGANDTTVTDAYATGAVTASLSTGTAGGLVGTASSNSSLNNVYATGEVSAFIAGGLIGSSTSGTITNAYWDTDTSGTLVGVGSNGNGVSPTGLTTAQLTAALPSGFSSSIWGNLNNQTTPYLLALTTSGSQPVYFGSDSTDLFWLIFTMGELQNINNDLSGNYALATSLDASTTSNWIPIGTNGSGTLVGSGFTGIFDGLGNTVSNLTVSTLSNNPVGLFGLLNGTIRNIGIVNGSFTGVSDVGALVGISNGTVTNSYSTGTVIGFSWVGGLIGDSAGTVSNSYSTSQVTGEIVPGSSSGGNPSPLGGLIGEMDGGSVTNSHASGDVTAADGSYMGGLIGLTNTGTTVSNSYATGNVTATSIVNGGYGVGGLIGFSDTVVTNSYATGAVTGEFNVGGLIGFNDGSGGSVANSYATGSVTAIVDPSFGLFGNTAGGLIGYDGGAAPTTNVYATGSVSGDNLLGGLIGELFNSLTNAYSTGAVRVVSGGSGTNVGGLIGRDDLLGSITNAYWDKQTSGITDPTAGAGDISNDSGITGLTTAQLQGASLVSLGFDPTVWGTGTGLYPYFLWQYPAAGGTPLAISGTAYTDAGVTPLSAGTVSLLVDGGTQGTVSSGANGYYYFLLAPGSLNESQALAYTSGGAALGENLSTPFSGLNIYANALNVFTNASNYSIAGGHLHDALGSGNPTVASFVAGLPDYNVTSSAASFTVDTAPDFSHGNIGIADSAANGQLIVSAPISWSNANQLTLNSAGSLAINAPINVTGAGKVVLDAAYDTTTVPGTSLLELSFAQGDSIDYGATNNGGTLSINGSAYTLLYSMSDLAGINTNSALAGNYALATSLDATTTSGWAPLGTDGAGNIGNTGNGFAGIFDGLGHTISNLTVNIGTYNDAGLFGYSSGTIRDIGVAGGSTSGYSNVGALVGENVGIIGNSYATGGVVSASGDIVGGLVGGNVIGTISNSYAADFVTGDIGVGGLVGRNGGTITNAYATGAVSGNADIGGLVGGNVAGTISNVYATGWVGGSSQVGGLVGLNSHGSISNNGYWNTETNGTTTGIGFDGNAQTVTGLTTAQLQGTLPSGFSSSVWGTGTGLYPYFLRQYPSTPQAISGTAYNNGGGTPLVAGTVSALADGASLGSASTGANGYYYILMPGSTITSATGAVLASSNGVNAGARLDTGSDVLDSNGNVSGFDIWGSTLIAPTTTTTYSAASATSLQTQDAALIAQAVGANSDPTTGLSNFGYIASGNFTIDTQLTLLNGLYVKSAGNITLADAITLPGATGLTLNAAGSLAVNAPVSVTGAGRVELDAGYDTTTAPGTSLLELSFGSGASIDYGAANNGGTLSINGTSYTLLYSMSDVQGINSALGGKYALATSLDATSTTGWTPLGPDVGHTFSGIFEGLGNTISNLTINGTDYVGLFGDSFGTVRDIGLLGGSSSGLIVVGALAGANNGTISNAYATGTVVGFSLVGGLAGSNEGTIADSYATGAVTGVSEFGGLVGQMYGGRIARVYATGAVTGAPNTDFASGGLIGTFSGGTLTDAYATGAVSGDNYVGGLIGLTEGGAITNVYSTGAVSGASAVGGLVGLNHSGSISAGYWDTETSGTGLGVGANFTGQLVTGLTTAQMQGGIPASFNSAIWGSGSGLFPYFLWRYPTTPQAISGIAYNNGGGTALSGSTVTTLVNGNSLGSVTTAANGYYYFLEPSGTITSGAAVLAYTGGANGGARVDTASGNTISGFDIWGSTLIAPTTATTYSSASATPLQTQDAALIAQAVGGNSDPTVGLTNYGYIASADFTVDAPLTLSNGLYVKSRETLRWLTRSRFKAPPG